MVGKSKYDIMDEMGEKISSNLIEYLKMIDNLSQGMEPDELDFEGLSVDINEKLEGILLDLKVSAHFGYEMAKDLYKINQKEILSSLKRNGINVDRFNEGYSKLLNRYSKTLLMFLIVEKEELNIIEFGAASKELVNGNTECLLEAIKESSVSVGPENYELVVKMADENFYVGDLSNDQIQRLNTFHEDFMKRRIYPKITAVVDEKNKILERVIAIGKFSGLY